VQREPAEARPPEASLIYRPESYVDRLEWQRVFPVDRPLEVELGSGDGGFLCAWAQLHPDRNFLGIERLLGRLRKLDRKGRRLGLDNLRLVRIEAFYFLKCLVPPDSISALHIYFPDPWPKRRHWKNRLFNPEFVQAVARTLRHHGHIFVRTDSADYFAQIEEVLEGGDLFLPVETPDELKAVLTDFEREFHARGLPTLEAAWRRM
jgi:tRNA (guanine-N7-)-methyltransferase